jgi:molybdopterin-guanine dinucleotide biosynthesis protein A
VSFDGIVLAGGASRRMGRHKPALRIGDRTLLDVARAALAGAQRTVVVGPEGDLVEDPPGEGPVAALVAGLALLHAPIVVVLAADLPFVTADAVARLVAAAPAVAVDSDGRDQHLLAAYPTERLRAALTGRRMREVTAALSPARLALPGHPPPWWDCDTAADLARARMWS